MVKSKLVKPVLDTTEPETRSVRKGVVAAIIHSNYRAIFYLDF